MPPFRSRRRTRTAAVLAVATTAALLHGATASATAAPAAPGAVLPVTDGPDRALLLVANTEGPGRVDFWDGLTTAPGSGFETGLGGGDQVAVGNVDDDPDPEIVVAEGDNGTVFGFDQDGDQVVTVQTAYDDDRDVLAVGDVNGDGRDEILVANDERGGAIDVTDVVTGPTEHSGFDSTFDDGSGNGFAAGDADGDGLAEVFIGNHRHGGRVDVLDPRTGLPLENFGVDDTTLNDDGSSEFAVGDVDGNGQDEVLVANHGHGGRIDVLSPRTHGALTEFGVGDSTFNDTDENQFKVADVDGDGKAEALVANAEDHGRIDVLDPRTHVPVPGLAETGFDTDDLFAVEYTSADIDGDDIPDKVETGGVRDATGAVALDLAAVPSGVPGRPNLPASPCRKDIVVQIDWMDDADPAHRHDHRPDDEAIAAVTAAFADAPVAVVPDCPYGPPAAASGINLIVQVDEALTERTPLPMPSGFAQLKAAHFVAALDGVVHYVVFAHDAGDFVGRTFPAGDRQDIVLTVDRCDPPTPPGTVDCVPGSTSVGQVQAEASTLLHELGHSVGLHHGGAVDDPATPVDDREVNCKPNYLSVMNYFFSSGLFRDKPVGSPGPQRVPTYDFSRADLADLVERTPDGAGPPEALGIGTEPELSGLFTSWGTDPHDFNHIPNVDKAGGPLDFNADFDDGIAGDADPVDLNDNANHRCASAGSDETLTGFDDWAYLDAGLHVWDGDGPPVEPTTAETVALTQQWDTALFPDVTTRIDPPRPGYGAPVLGLAVDGERVFATHYYNTLAQPPTADRKGTLAVLSRTTNQVVARTQVGLNPRSVAVNPKTKRVYVVNYGDGVQANYTLSVLDETSLRLVEEIPLGQVGVDVAVNTTLNRVYVANPYQKVVQVIDGATNTKLDPIPVGNGPVALAVDESRGLVHVALSDRSDPLTARAALGTIVDDGVNRPRVLPPVSLGDPLVQPWDVAVDPTTNRVYLPGLGAAGQVAPSLTAVDVATRTITGRLPLPGPGRAVAVNPDVHQAFVAVQTAVKVVDLRTLTVVRTMPASQAFSVTTEQGSGRLVWSGDVLDGTLSRRSYSSGQPV